MIYNKNSKEYYAGGFIFDNDHYEIDDIYITRFEYEDLVEDLKRMIKRKSGSEILLCCFVASQGRETDLTDKLKRSIYG